MRRRPRKLYEINDLWKNLFIELGWYRYVRDPKTRELVRELTRPNWHDDYSRQRATRFFVETILKKDPRSLTVEDFRSSGATGILAFNSGSPYRALLDAGYDLNPDDMATGRPEYFTNERNRIREVRALVDRLKKDPRELSRKDFVGEDLTGLIDYYHGSPYQALMEAGYQIEPWEMAWTPKGYFDDPKNRMRAVLWLAIKLDKNPKDLMAKDFIEAGMYSLMRNYNGSVYEILRSVDWEIEPWEMRKTPMRYFDSEENRVRATRWLIQKTGKDPRDIKIRDFSENGLYSLLSRHGNKPYVALIEAGYQIEPWEMQQTPDGFWRDRENRARAIRWLVEKTGKDARDLTSKDFTQHRLGGLLFSHWYNGSPYEALLDAGFVTLQDESYMRTRGNARYLRSRVA